MKINKIVLNNFGSYEGETVFETGSLEGRNIVLIGGKNGAGKTTLFTAMRVCLYGYMSMGYKNYNSYYIRAITKLVNNNAKLSRPTTAGVSMEIELSNGRGMDNYQLVRNWELSDSLIETYHVYKNGTLLTDAETADFEKFVLSLIPPELFNLYFFDGEKIADFFLNEGSNSRIKDAFLTLCGYDTFDIMRRNFRRLGGNGTTSTPALEEYLVCKDELSNARKTLEYDELRLQECIDSIANCEATIDAVERDYHQKGGITEEEWNQKLFIIKEEEKKRESYNALLKKWANELIPFLMLREQIIGVKSQINAENDAQKYKNFCEILDSTEIKRLVADSSDTLKQLAFKQYGNNKAPLLNLSVEQGAIVFAQINQVLSFDREKIGKCKSAIKRSIALTAKTRKELESSSITSVQEYMKKRAQLFEEKSGLLVMRVELETQIVSQRALVQEIEIRFGRIQNKLEDELKKVSIHDISARAIVMLDKLQQVLYRKQLARVEMLFRNEINVLMRKKHFIDDIVIDDKFGIHIFRTERIAVSKLNDAIISCSDEQLNTLLGQKAVEKLCRLSKESGTADIRRYLDTCNRSEITLPLEIDKSSLSNGEKQIFIMALYHSLVSLCTHEIPFIIDTPFARIDTEHRRNISQYFFSQLRGQVFILSTNEEINSAHVQILNDKISATYMLENADNQGTKVLRDSYFEV